MAGRPYDNLGLFTDFYELTMGSSLHAHGLDATATFELSVRRLPTERRYLVACGMEAAIEGLTCFRLDEHEVAYLNALGTFDESFVARLGARGFTGDVNAVAEGEVVFAGEPIVQVTAPLVEAQLVETFLLNAIGFPTLVASKASRVSEACGDTTFVEFGARRAHGVDAAMSAARAAYVGGAAGTSLAAAGHRFAIPVSGTMAHSYVMSFDREIDAFATFADSYPDGNAVLLLDTYDTLDGARGAVEVAAQGKRFRGVRLDSGDLVALSRGVRAILDGAGLTHVTILASGDLDEFRIAELLEAGAPIDAFGVGTQLSTSADAPSMSCIYKLVEDPRGAKMKKSEGKVTWPGRKQVYRVEHDGRAHHDVVALAEEAPPAGGRALLRPVMRSGALVDGAVEPLEAIRRRRADAVKALPAGVRAVNGPAAPYEVRPSAALDRLIADTAGRRH